MAGITTHRWQALGCTNEIQIAWEDAEQATEAVKATDLAVACVERWEACLSRFRPSSELCALNRAAGTWFSASADLFAIVATALNWAQKTGGLFDPTILNAIQAAGYDRSFTQIAHRESGAPATPARVLQGRYAQVQLDPASQAIWLPPEVGIDLGGIGKGWIADALLEQVFEDFPNVLINLGGDLRVRGGPTDAPGWVIGITDPRRVDETTPAYLGGFALRAGGVATSGAAWRWWLQAGQMQHHLIDPRTGRPATQVAPLALAGGAMAVTALAETATTAEVLAKYALLLGMEQGLAFFAQEDAQAAAVYILGDGTLVPSRDIQHFIACHQ